MIPREAVSTRTARGYLATLREHLEARIDTKRAEGRPTGYEESRTAALTWALEVCENEWDVLVRRQKERADA